VNRVKIKIIREDGFAQAKATIDFSQLSGDERRMPTSHAILKQRTRHAPSNLIRASLVRAPEGDKNSFSKGPRNTFREYILRATYGDNSVHADRGPRHTGLLIP